LKIFYSFFEQGGKICPHQILPVLKRHLGEALRLAVQSGILRVLGEPSGRL
jgi:hypothetical protein